MDVIVKNNPMSESPKPNIRNGYTSSSIKDKKGGRRIAGKI